jgi:CheY-like chemotaxis protein
MDGNMWVESQPGDGSTFHFTVGFRPAPSDFVPNRTRTAVFPSASSERAFRILLAEDNPVNQRLTIRLLEKQGHSVMTVGTGIDAVHASAEERFDVILMDVHMPELDGIQATRRIRLRESTSREHVPIIAMTASAMKEDRQRCLNAGMDAYISKPVRPDELLSTLRTVIHATTNEVHGLVLTH